jgi:Tfp pilus assembly protein PilF
MYNWLWALLIPVAFALFAERLTRGRRARLRFQRGLEAYQRGDWPNAERDLKKVVRMVPSAALARRVYGRVLAQVGDTDQAEEHMRFATQLEPRNADGLLDLAIFLTAYRPKMRDEALALLEQVVELDPKLGPALPSIPSLRPHFEEPRFQALAERPAGHD